MPRRAAKRLVAAAAFPHRRLCEPLKQLPVCWARVWQDATHALKVQRAEVEGEAKRKIPNCSDDHVGQPWLFHDLYNTSFLRGRQGTTKVSLHEEGRILRLREWPRRKMRRICRAQASQGRARGAWSPPSLTAVHVRARRLALNAREIHAERARLVAHSW